MPLNQMTKPKRMSVRPSVRLMLHPVWSNLENILSHIQEQIIEYLNDPFQFFFLNWIQTLIFLCLLTPLL